MTEDSLNNTNISKQTYFGNTIQQSSLLKYFLTRMLLFSIWEVFGLPHHQFKGSLAGTEVVLSDMKEVSVVIILFSVDISVIAPQSSESEGESFFS